MNANIPRWVIASVLKHFNTYKSTMGMYFEGQRVENKPEANYFEVRIDGPSERSSSNSELIIFEINILVSAKADVGDIYQIYRNVGVVASAFHNTIEVFKYGTGGEDDESSLGCLQLYSQGHGDLQIVHFGRINSQIPLIQATVEGHYQLNL